MKSENTRKDSKERSWIFNLQINEQEWIEITGLIKYIMIDKPMSDERFRYYCALYIKIFDLIRFKGE